MNLELLKQERVKRSFSQKYMAEKLGFRDRSSYCLIENGKTAISVDLARQIAIILQLEPDKTLEIFFPLCFENFNSSITEAEVDEHGKCN